MENSHSRTPSPSSASATPKGNPFSIDYILSSSAVAAKHQQQQQLPDQSALEQLNMMNQQRANLMAAAAAAAAAAAQSNELVQHQQTAMAPIKAGQQPQSNILYFIQACMILQQQQQQHQQQQQQQQQQLQQQRRQQNLHQQASTCNQQLASRQPIDLARSPMDSLAILARLTAAAPNELQPNNLNGFGKHVRVPVNQAIRTQPYPAPNRPYPPQASIMSQLHTSIGLNQMQQDRSSALDLLNNQQPLMNLKPSHHHQVNKYVMGSNSSGSSSQPTHRNSSNCAGDKLDNLKPAHSYIGLIGMCILSTPDKRMVLNDIYQFILDNYPYYRNRGSGWRNSVRHNLSLNECFQKSGRAANGKGHYWTIHPANMEDFMMGDFRRRRAQRKVRRWNNMDVPSDESEDESIEDATKPPLPEHFKRSLEMHRQLELEFNGANRVEL